MEKYLHLIIFLFLSRTTGRENAANGLIQYFNFANRNSRLYISIRPCGCVRRGKYSVRLDAGVPTCLEGALRHLAATLATHFPTLFSKSVILVELAHFLLPRLCMYIKAVVTYTIRVLISSKENLNPEDKFTSRTTHF